MKEFYSKIDSHSHVGPSYLGPQSEIETYILNALNIGVKAAVLAPGPSPEITEGNRVYNPCLWKINDNEVRYVQEIRNINGDIENVSAAQRNPYHDTNVDLFNLVKKYKSVSLYGMPLHHPILDTPEEVRDMLFKFPSIALKLHGIATFTGPEDVASSTIDALRESNKPLVVHTDRFEGETTTPLLCAYHMNDSRSWVNWARETGVRTLITHGARLSQEAIEMASSCSNIMIGIAPDLLITEEKDRLAIATNEYLEMLMTLTPPNKLLYDIDYGWNVKKRGEWGEQDWNAHQRIEEVATRLGLSPEQQHQIFYDNAVKFFCI